MPERPDADPASSNLAVEKRELRAEMRQLRRNLPDRAERSARLWDRVKALDVVEQASRFLVFDTIPGEPETELFIEWCHSVGKQVAVPEDGIDPTWPDVVIVPGLAFTAAGARVGQGGGWYDRFLSKTRTECTSIGVCFEPQQVANVPTEDHDVLLDLVITD